MEGGEDLSVEIAQSQHILVELKDKNVAIPNFIARIVLDPRAKFNTGSKQLIEQSERVVHFCRIKLLFESVATDELDLAFKTADDLRAILIKRQILAGKVELIQGIDDLQWQLKVHIVEKVVNRVLVLMCR